MKITFMGTGGFGLPSLEALLRTSHEINAVITMPSRGFDKKKQPLSSPVREFVQRKGIPFYEPDNINSEEGRDILDHLQSDLFFVCDFGRLLKPEVIAKAKYGAINLHASILPKYRGGAPINWAILSGEQEIGISIFQLEATMDSGPVLGIDSYCPSEQDTAVEVEEELRIMGVPLVLDAIRQIELGSVIPVQQDSTQATSARRLKKEDGIIQWDHSSTAIINQYRGLQPWPKVFTNWYRKDHPESEPLRLILGPFERVDDSELENRYQNAIPGTILEARGDIIFVKTGDGILKIVQIQPSGRKTMFVDAFLRGYAMKPDDQLGIEEKTAQ